MKIVFLSLVIAFLSQKGECNDFHDGIQELSASQPLQHINRVLICVNEALSQQLSSKNFIKLFKTYSNIEKRNVRECFDLIQNDDGTILAVITPKPFYEISSSQLPMYFYDTPSFGEEYVDVFPNAVVHVNRHPLKYAFTHFFKSQKWERIAIISDDSVYSAAFEEELVGQLHEEQFVYNVQRCVQVNNHDKCNFNEALQFVEEQKAYIVVLNIDAMNARSLARAASRQPGTWEKYAWLTRDSEVAYTVTEKFTHTLSFTLAPKLHQHAYINLITTVPYGPQLSSMLQGLQLISDAVKTSKRERIDHFYRDIAEHMRSVINSTTYKIQAFIEVVVSSTKGSLISVLTINGEDTSVSYSSNVPRILDLEDCTLMRSRIFTAPCNDNFIMLFVIVILIFTIIFVLLAYFCNRYLVWT